MLDGVLDVVEELGDERTDEDDAVVLALVLVDVDVDEDNRFEVDEDIDIDVGEELSVSHYAVSFLN